MATDTNRFSDPHRVQRELITGSVVIAAIVMFIWTGGSAMTAIVRHLTGLGPNVEQILLTALLLNIALILFGWRRYRDLQMEVQQRREAEERARMLAETDSLTGFLNRRSMVEKTAGMLKEATRGGQAVAIFLLDLDNFKAVNDMHGHAAGDQVLITAAQRIKALLPPAALAARPGGDEFVCVVPYDPGASDHADAVARQLVNAMSTPMTPGGLHIRIGTSIGVAKSETGLDTVETLIKRADIAMYCAKRQGRNRYAWFDPSMERELAVRNTLESGIRQGIARGEFLPYYEPQMMLSRGMLTGFDLTPRWNHPVEGLVLPTLFGPIAEESGLSVELALAVMRRAFEEARNWNPSLTLSVPVSAVLLKDPWLSQKIRKLLVETGFVANRLEIAIAERALFDNLDIAQPVIGSFRNQGIRIILDDFGTGYGSLAHLRSLAVDGIRISSSLVGTAGRAGDDTGIIDAIVRLAETLAVPVTADGIKNEHICERMRELGCGYGKGLLFGAPMPIERVQQMLAERDLLLPATGQAPPASEHEESGPQTDHPERKAL